LRDQLVNLNAIKAEICAISTSVSDPGVARVKLDWWRSEADRLAAGNPSHRLARIYYQACGEKSDISLALRALIAGLDEEIGGRILASKVDSRAWFDSTFGPLYQFQASLLDEQSKSLIAVISDLGRCIEMGYSLLYMRPFAARNIRRIPASALSDSGCTWDDIENLRDSPTLINLLNNETRSVIKAIAEIHVQTNRKMRRKHLPVFTLSAIVKNALIEMHADGCRIWQHRVELTPLHKLWLAWRIRYL
jgi:phytoene synthase